MKQEGAAAGSRLPYVWMLLSSLFCAAMATLGHALGTRCDWPLIALARSLVPLAGRDAALLAALAASVLAAVALIALHCLKDVDERAVLFHFSTVSLLLSLGSLLVFGGSEAFAGLPAGGSLVMLVGVGVTATLG